MEERQNGHDDLKSTLVEIEKSLVEERAALRKLDGPAIDVATDRKTELEVKLRRLLQSGAIAQPEDRATIERVRNAALVNQLLLVHARSCVRGAIAMVSGESYTPYAPSVTTATMNAPPPPKKSTARAMRVNTRG